MAHAPECSGRVYGCPKCGKREMTIDETFDHKCPDDAVVLVLREGRMIGLRQHDAGSAYPIRENNDGDVVCPCCGHNDVAMWADDGEADLADYFQCETFSGGCGAEGAVTYAADHSKTLNGCAVS